MINEFRKPLFLAVFLGIFLNNFGQIMFAQSIKSNTFARNAIQKEARKLEKEGRFEEALTKYKEAIRPEMLNYDWQAGVGRGGIMRIYRHLEKYDEALNELQWFLEMNPTKYEDARRELLALKEYKKDKNPKHVLEHIKYLRENLPTAFPPQGISSHYIATVLRLYDAVGDYDAGIAFVDEVMAYFRETDIKKYGEYKPGKVDREYLKVRDAFEQDKADGAKGRTTQVIIQSDHFPW